MTISLRVRELAEAKGFINARELADAAGISYQAAYGYWNDTAVNLNRHTLAKLCKALGVHVALLIDDDFVFGGSQVSPESVRARIRRRYPKRPAS
jgi:DNA-binding Xre family transcriptional regulator